MISSDHLVQSPCSSSTSRCRLSRTTSIRFLNVFKDGESTVLLGQGSQHPSGVHSSASWALLRGLLMFLAPCPGAEPRGGWLKGRGRHRSHRPALEGRTGCGKRGQRAGQAPRDSPSQKHSAHELGSLHTLHVTLFQGPVIFLK